MKKRERIWLVVVLGVAVGLSCDPLQPNPEMACQYLRLVQPLRPETRAYFCERLDLESDHRVCRSDRYAMAIDLYTVIGHTL